MDNLYDLISKGDFLILFVYIILGYIFLKSFVFKKMDRDFKNILTVFFAFKVLCSLIMTLLIVYYWGVSDNVAFYNESRNIVKLISTDISNIKYFFLPVEQYNDKIKLDNELSATVSSIGVESNFLVAKISAILYPISYGRYLIINFLFSFIATIGQLKMYSALCNRYPQLKKRIGLSILFIPSVLLYSSYLNKETLCLAFIGFGIYHFFEIANKKNIPVNTCLLLVNIFLIGLVKVYVLYSFFTALLLFYFVKLIMHFFRKSIISKFLIGIILISLTALFVSNLDYFDPYIADFATTSNTFQQQYNADYGETSSFEFGEVETSFSGLLKKAPLGIYTTYFRPHLWEVNKPIILFSALESFIMFLLTFWALFVKRKFIGPLMRKDYFAGISFFYVLVFGVIVGLTTFNFGSLVRYKIPAEPFLLVFVFLLMNCKTKNFEPSKE